MVCASHSNLINQLGYSEKACRRLADLLRSYKHTLAEDEVGAVWVWVCLCVLLLRGLLCVCVCCGQCGEGLLCRAVALLPQHTLAGHKV